MERYYDSVEIAELLNKMVTAELSDSEKNKLAFLLKRNNLNNKEDLERIINQSISIQPETIDAEKKEEILASLREKVSRKKRLFRKRVLAYASAAAVLAIAILSIYPTKVPPVSEQNVNISLISTQEAVLEYPSGNQVALPKEAVVSSLIAPEDTAKEQQIASNLYTIKVPLGSTHSLTLEDGTSIMLYPGSELSFPAHFLNSERLVSLRGEAYFDVHHEEDRPFKVHAGDVAVKVLGTSFNIRAYADENSIETALVSGVVNINDTRLKPNEMAVYNDASQTLKVETINASIYKERAAGMFVFENRPLEEIMHDLSRWFDFTYDYSDEIMKGKQFRLKISRTDDFKKILEMMEFTKEVGFKITDQHIEILPEQ